MIEQGIQTDFPDEQIQKWGCYFLCLVRWAQSITGEDFPIDKICAERNEALRRKYIDHEMTILNAPALLNHLIGRYECTTVIRQTVEPETGRYIACLTKPGYTHFVFIEDGKQWDSLDPDRPAAADYRVESYRVIF
jgi:hypothetical protein